MKKLFLFLSSVIFQLTNLCSQNMLTYRNVYDFNINDEFQYRYTHVPPNAERIKIIGKYFSANNDTVFYIRHFNNYWSVVDFTTNPPHLVFNTSTGNDTVHYANLDTLINTMFKDSPPNDLCNSNIDSLYYSSLFCNTFVYQNTRRLHFCFEGQTKVEIYGKGLGKLYYLDSYPSQTPNDLEWELFYFKKNGVDCGKADSTIAVSVFENGNANDGILLFPNPFSAQTILKVSEDLRNATVTLYNSFGQEVRQMKNISGNSITLYRDNLPSGLYFLCIRQGPKTFASGKIVITD